MEPTELAKEGITKELLNSIDMQSDYSPAQLEPGKAPVKLVKGSDGYWVMLEFGMFLRDGKNHLIVFSEEDARVGRARYLLNFKEDIIEQKILVEIEAFKNEVDKTLENLLPNLRMLLVYGEKIEPEDFDTLVFTLLGKADLIKKKSKAAELLQDIKFDIVGYYNKLKELQAKKDYDTLYMVLFQNGLPLIASFDVNSTKDMEIMANYLHVLKIEKTLANIQVNNHLYNVAKFKVLKLDEIKNTIP